VLRLSIQTVEPWKRIAIAVLGLLAGAFAVVCYRGGAPWWIWVPFGLASVTVVLCGVFGRKAYIDRELQKLSEEWPRRILDAISNAI
jgi:fatty acid desaturase